MLVATLSVRHQVGDETALRDILYSMCMGKDIGYISILSHYLERNATMTIITLR